MSNLRNAHVALSILGVKGHQTAELALGLGRWDVFSAALRMPVLSSPIVTAFSPLDLGKIPKR